jgi:hypothetical protein
MLSFHTINNTALWMIYQGLETARGQGQGYITTNNQSASMSWYRAQSRTIDQSLLSP